MHRKQMSLPQATNELNQMTVLYQKIPNLKLYTTGGSSEEGLQKLSMIIKKSETAGFKEVEIIINKRY